METIEWDDIQKLKIIGKGGFGEVWLAYSKLFGDVAIKTSLFNGDERLFQEFLNEANLLLQLNSPNIIRCYGTTKSDQGNWIIMEYAANGSLFRYISDCKERGYNEAFPWEERIRISLEISRGLLGIHSQKVLHRDMKSLNVLLDRNLTAKIADFGLSKAKTNSMSKTTNTNNTGSILWKAPETFSIKNTYTEKADIFSLGVVFWEIATGEIPYQECDMSTIIESVKSGERLDIPPDVPRFFQELIEICWDNDPLKRPNASKVVDILTDAYLKQRMGTSSDPRVLQLPKILGSSPSPIVSQKGLVLCGKLIDSDERYTSDFKWEKIQIKQFSSEFVPSIFEKTWYDRFPNDKKILVFQAENGNSQAQYELSQMFYNGTGVPQNYSKAFEWAKMSSDNNDTNGHNMLGVLYSYGQGVEKNPEQAVMLFTKAAEAGNPKAQNNLGSLYENGKFVKKDYSIAFKWYQKSAEQFDPSGQNSMGLLYQHGRGVEKDLEEAYHYFQKASNNGHSGAFNNLGVMFRDGIFISKNLQEAFTCFKKSAERGDPNGQCNLGLMYENGFGVERNYTRAFELYLSSSKQGNTYAQNNLGYLYETGHGVGQDYQKALEWYTKSANGDNPSAKNNLGCMYRDGKGVPQSDLDAIGWFLLSAEQGNSSGQCNLGSMYRDGRGVQQNYKTAIHWYQSSASQGDVVGMNNLGAMFFNGYGVDQDYQKALDYYMQAANMGNSFSMFNIGVMFETGKGVEKDIEKAIEWYNKAKDKGYVNAAKRIDGIQESQCNIQ